VPLQPHPAGQVGGDMCEIAIFPAGVDDQEKPLAAQIGDHQIVKNAA
jgi:hypothetical protein